MRLSTTNVFLYDGLLSQQRNNTLELTYRGQTTGNTPTELFVDGTLNRRIVPDRSSALILNVMAVAFNATTGAALTSNTALQGAVSAAGVITVPALAGTGNLSEYAFGAAAFGVQGTRLGSAGVAVDNSYFIDVVPITGSTPAFLRLQVRGVAANTINWEIAVRAVEATGLNG